ncbi:hypothetical protein E4U60_000701 [Claviceps pazoutovae]|uniref:Ubiquitin 3 binding protein But2 C-terminal domain-containing protein n=1 Tax=Claviceps pazoutovae TaxID=1649127 RepID=A0A9P7ME02_9HYPO|nr:hypothetical protein E4U60_000701 [Claviceps pazoutovae]
MPDVTSRSAALDLSRARWGKSAEDIFDLETLSKSHSVLRMGNFGTVRATDAGGLHPLVFCNCTTDNMNQRNIYQKSGAGTNCGQITLVADGCHADCPQPAQFSASAPVTKDCPANLDGAYEFPHLIIPVDKSNPDKVYGTSFFGEVTPSRSSIFNFDIPVRDRDKTCTLIFLFPDQSQLETSSYTLYGDGKIHALALDRFANTSTTWNNKPGKRSAGRTAICNTPRTITRRLLDWTVHCQVLSECEKKN